MFLCCCRLHGHHAVPGVPGPSLITYSTTCRWRSTACTCRARAAHVRQLRGSACARAQMAGACCDAWCGGPACSAILRPACRAARRWPSWRTAPTTSRRSPGARASLLTFRRACLPFTSELQAHRQSLAGGDISTRAAVLVPLHAPVVSTLHVVSTLQGRSGLLRRVRAARCSSAHARAAHGLTAAPAHAQGVRVHADAGQGAAGRARRRGPGAAAAPAAGARAAVHGGAAAAAGLRPGVPRAHILLRSGVSSSGPREQHASPASRCLPLGLQPGGSLVPKPSSCLFSFHCLHVRASSAPTQGLSSSTATYSLVSSWSWRRPCLKANPRLSSVPWCAQAASMHAHAHAIFVGSLHLLLHGTCSAIDVVDGC